MTNGQFDILHSMLKQTLKQGGENAKGLAVMMERTKDYASLRESVHRMRNSAKLLTIAVAALSATLLGILIK